MRTSICATLLLSLTGNAWCVDIPPDVKALCVYDSWCTRLQNSDGSFIQAKPGMLKVLTELNEPLRVTAQSLGVDSRALAGGILAENSMNAAVDDDIHSFLEKVKLNPLASAASQLVRGKSFSLGFGQIKPESALAAEPILAKAEGRPRRGLEEITHEILNPLGSLKYAAAIIRQCQDVYEEQGFQVKNNPEILATLYNLGNCQDRAKTAKANGKLPRPNFFGVFVKHYKDQIESVVDYKRAYNPAEAKKLLEDQADPSKNTVKSVQYQKSLTTSANLTTTPPRCDGGNGGDSDDYDRALSLTNGDIIASNASGDYDVVSNSIDCDLKDWTLIRTKDGKTGWISSDQLSADTKDRAVSSSSSNSIRSLFNKPETCNPADAESCAKKAAALTGKGVLGKSADGLLDIKAVGDKNKPNDPHLKNFSSRCLRNNDVSSGGAGFQTIKMTNYTPKDIAVIQNRIAVKKAEIVKEYNLKTWDDPHNNFRSAFQFESSIDYSCKTVCQTNGEQLNKILNADYSKFKTYSGYKDYLLMNSYNSVYFNTVSPEAIEQSSKTPSAIVKDYFADIEKECAGILAKSDDLKASEIAMRNRFTAAIENDSNYQPNFSRTQISNSASVSCKILDLGAKSSDQKTEASACTDCSISIPVSNGNYSSTVQMSGAVAKSLITDEEDIEAIIKAQLDNLRMLLPNGGYSDDRSVCKYDPHATLERVKALLSLDCVESAFVPDAYLLNKLSSFKGRVVYKAFETDDRFAVRLKNNCLADGVM